MKEEAAAKGRVARAAIGVVVNGHCEGAVLARTLDSLALARRYAAERGCGVDVHLVLDRADAATRDVAEQRQLHLTSCIQVDFGNLGSAREAGLAQARNEWIAFLDGDDLISRNWLYEAYAHAQASERPRDTIFHTELFVGFGAEVFFRRAVRSIDPEFDPLCLIADWFFCNNLFAHRSVFERCPIEPYDHENGLGAEDWHWSCQTLALGFARDFVPRTAYFYRVKPPSLSLGMTGGLVHKASRLYDPETVRTMSLQRARGAAEDSRALPAPDTPHLRRRAPDWIREHALDQARVEAQLVEVPRAAHAGDPNAYTFPPRIHYGAAEFYRRAVLNLEGAERKVALFWGANARLGGTYFLERMIEATVVAYPGRQIVVFSEADSLANDFIRTRFNGERVSVLDYSAARAQFQIPTHYLAMVTVRFFLQFEFDAIINVGSPAFDEVVARHDRAVAYRCKTLFELVPYLVLDRIDPGFCSFARALPHRVRFLHRVLCLSESIADFVNAGALSAADVGFDPRLRAAVKNALRLRWSGDRTRMQNAYDATEFSALFERGPSIAPRQRYEAATKPVGDLGVVVLANGECPELAAVYENAARPLGATLHVLALPAHLALVRARAQSCPEMQVHELKAWTVAGVVSALECFDQTWFAVLEPGAIVSAEFLKLSEGLLREQDGHGAVIPEACVRSQGDYWDLHRFDGSIVSTGVAGEFYVGGLRTLGAVFVSALWVTADLAGRGGAEASATTFATFAAVAAAESNTLRVASQCLALSTQGIAWPEHEWAKLLPPPPSVTRPWWSLA